MSKRPCCYCCCLASVVSKSVRPHRQQPTRLHRPWDSPGKNTGVGCHFLLQCFKVKTESEVAKVVSVSSWPRGRSLPGSSIHGIFQARVLEWGATASSTKRPMKWSEVKSLSRVQLIATPWLLRPWDSPGKNTRAGCHFLLQGIFPIQGSNPGLSHCGQTR